MNVLQGGEGTADDLLCCSHHPLEPLCLCFSAVGKPHSVAVQQDALYCRPVKGYLQLLTHTVLPEHSHKVQALLGCYGVVSIDRSAVGGIEGKEQWA